MTKHYVLNVDPAAEYDWDRCTLRDPITAERPELAQLVADVVGKQAGAYLISVDIQIKVLEQAPTVQPKPIPINKSDSKSDYKADSTPHSQPKEKVA